MNRAYIGEGGGNGVSWPEGEGTREENEFGPHFQTRPAVCDENRRHTSHCTTERERNCLQCRRVFVEIECTTQNKEINVVDRM